MPPMAGVAAGGGGGSNNNLGAKTPASRNTGPRYSDMPNLPSAASASGGSPASAQLLKATSAAVSQALGANIQNLKASGMLSSRDSKRLMDVEKRLGELYNKLDSGSGISDRTCATLNDLCSALTGPGGIDIAMAKKLHLKLVTEDVSRSNLKWLTGVKQLLTMLHK